MQKCAQITCGKWPKCQIREILVSQKLSVIQYIFQVNYSLEIVIKAGRSDPNWKRAKWTKLPCTQILMCD